MSTVSALEPNLSQSDGADVRGVAALLTPGNLVMAGLLAAAFLLLFFRWFLVQHAFAMNSPDDWGHVYIVPLISGYILWKRRDALLSMRSEVFWPGLPLILLGISCYFLFVITNYANHMFQGFAIVLTLAGLAILLLGPRMFPLLAFPIAYLAFGVTVSEMVMLKVTAQLQLMASWGSWVLLNVIGLVTERAGNVLVITTSGGEEIPLNVAEACSGMRMLVAFYALGAAVAFIACRHWWQRIALLLLAGPVAIFVNVLRVAFLGVGSLWNPELAKGDAHMLIGVLWLVPAFLLFMGVVWALNRIVRDEAPGAPDKKGVEAKP